MAIANAPLYTPMATADSLVSREWAAWFRTIWQRASEPWKFHPERGGLAKLTSGVIVIPCTVVKAASFIQLTAQDASANAGFLSIAIVSGTSITITSSNALDNRNVFWEIRESL